MLSISDMKHFQCQDLFGLSVASVKPSRWEGVEGQSNLSYDGSGSGERECQPAQGLLYPSLLLFGPVPSLWDGSNHTQGGFFSQSPVEMPS